MPTSQTLSEYLHDYAVKYFDKAEEMRARRQEWIGAVTRLLAQLRQWLTEADKDGVLHIEERKRELGEEALGGRYDVPQLRLVLGTRELFIRPMGRVTIARINDGDERDRKTQGWVELTTEGEWYALYRLLDGSEERWVLVPPLTSNDRQAVPLTRETFENAVLRLLK